MPNSIDTQSVTSVLTNLDLQDPSLKLVQEIVKAADERKGGNITILSVAEVTTLADYFIVVTGFSKVQVRAIANAIVEQVEETLNRKPRRSEGLTEGTWVLQDYGDVVVHVQMPQERDFYNLEAFWGHADRLSPAPFLGTL